MHIKTATKYLQEQGYQVFGALCLVIAIFLCVKLFGSLVSQELTYQITPERLRSQSAVVVPVDPEFSIVIGKIGANAKVIADVDPYNSSAYQRALTQGVAHAKGSGKPGEGKNIFIFAHSSGDLVTANRFNSVFYLLHHLQAGDQVDLWYQNQQYRYEVTTKKTVRPTELSVLVSPSTAEQLTLMTCWPPGTTISRLIVIAKLIN